MRPRHLGQVSTSSAHGRRKRSTQFPRGCRARSRPSSRCRQCSDESVRRTGVGTASRGSSVDAALPGREAASGRAPPERVAQRAAGRLDDPAELGGGGRGDAMETDLAGGTSDERAVRGSRKVPLRLDRVQDLGQPPKDEGTNTGLPIGCSFSAAGRRPGRELPRCPGGHPLRRRVPPASRRGRRRSRRRPVGHGRRRDRGRRNARRRRRRDTDADLRRRRLRSRRGLRCLSRRLRRLLGRLRQRRV